MIFYIKKEVWLKFLIKEINIKGVKVLMEPKNSKSNYWLNSLIIENFTLNELLRKTNENGISTPEWCGNLYTNQNHI